MRTAQHYTNIVVRLIWLAERAGYYRTYAREHPETGDALLPVAERYSRDAAALCGQVRGDSLGRAG